MQFSNQRSCRFNYNFHCQQCLDKLEQVLVDVKMHHSLCVSVGATNTRFKTSAILRNTERFTRHDRLNQRCVNSSGKGLNVTNLYVYSGMQKSIGQNLSHCELLSE